MNLQPLTHFISSIFSETAPENKVESGLVEKQGTSFRIDYVLYAQILRARDLKGHAEIIEHITTQLMNHSAITVNETN